MKLLKLSNKYNKNKQVLILAPQESNYPANMPLFYFCFMSKNFDIFIDYCSNAIVMFLEASHAFHKNCG